jgi:chromosome segregation ATPase
MYQAPDKYVVTAKIEQTKRDMYNDLKRFESMVGSTHLFKTFQDSLEAHLEELRKENALSLAMAGSMREERDAAQRRVQAVDHAYFEQSNLVGQQAAELDRVKLAAQTAGDCIRDMNTTNRAYQIDIKSLREQLQARDETIGQLRKVYGRDREDVMSAEKLSDELSDKLRDAQAVIGRQEQLIVGQRLAIAELYMRRPKAAEEKCAHSYGNHLGCPECGEVFKQCQHSFHPAFPSGEMCIFCGVKVAS